jgi:ABC-type lipoprotein release transport system permease subunit
VTIVGVEPEKEVAASLWAQKVVDGRYLTSADTDMVYIGKGLAEAMDVGVGDRFTLTGAIHQEMRSRTMTVAGIYDLGMPDIEKGTIYVTLSEAQDLYGLDGQVTEIAIFLKQIGEEPAVMDALRPSLGGAEITSWQTSFPELEQALATKGGAMNIFSIIMMVIVGIGILNLLLMAIYERTREIGILGALGLKPYQISTLFVLEGVLMGLVGVVGGVAFGLLLNGIVKQVGLDFAQYASLTSYMALISGKIYPTWGLDKLLQRTLIVLVITTCPPHTRRTKQASAIAEAHTCVKLRFIWRFNDDTTLQNGLARPGPQPAAHLLFDAGTGRRRSAAGVHGFVYRRRNARRAAIGHQSAKRPPASAGGYL